MTLWNPKYIVPFVPETQRICFQDTSWELWNLEKHYDHLTQLHGVCNLPWKHHPGSP